MQTTQHKNTLEFAKEQDQNDPLRRFRSQFHIPKDKNGKRKKKGVKRKISGTFPKYELITSHVCRRSFATNTYGKLPTPLIMQITAHSTEKMFLGYIGKSSMDYAQQIADFYAKEEVKKSI